MLPNEPPPATGLLWHCAQLSCVNTGPSPPANDEGRSKTTKPLLNRVVSSAVRPGIGCPRVLLALTRAWGECHKRLTAKTRTAETDGTRSHRTAAVDIRKCFMGVLLTQL